MKKLFILVLVVVIIAGGWYVFSKREGAAEDIEVAQVTSKPDARNATFDFGDGQVTLENGTAFSAVGGDAFVQTETTLTDKIAYGDINDDKKSDAVVILTQNSGGSGTFVYIAGYVSGNVQYKGSNAVFIGDRVSPQTLSIDSNGGITLTYLDRRSDEPMAAAPTVSATKHFAYRNGKLIEQ